MSTRTHLVLGCCLAMTGCAPVLSTMLTQGRASIRGSGVIIEQPREIGHVERLVVRGAFDAMVTVGPETKLVVRGDDNIVPDILTEVRDNELVIRMRDGETYSTSEPLRVTLSAPEIRSVEGNGAVTISIKPAQAGQPLMVEKATASGASTITLADAASGTLALRAEGASTIRASGKVATLEVKAVGASTLDVEGVESQHVKAEVSGASTARVRTSGRLIGRADGASTITVAGQPKERDVETSGASRVQY